MSVMHTGRMEDEPAVGPMRLRQLYAGRDGADDRVPAVLDGVDWTLHQGEWVFVVGTNGSGKSTLGRIVAGLGFPGELRAETWDRGFAGESPAPYVMQQPDAQLFATTPREEIVFALEWLGTESSAIPSLAAAALEEAGLSEAADLPWSELSGGQRQLAAVAAATAGQAPLLVLDEATSMLDSAAQARVRRLVRRLHREGSAVVWITQRIEELEPEHRVVAMADGRLAYDGSAGEFLYGEISEEGTREVPPCVRCGLRLPYEVELSRTLNKRWRTYDRHTDDGCNHDERTGQTRPNVRPRSEFGRQAPSEHPALAEDRRLPESAGPDCILRIDGWPMRGDEAARADRAGSSLTLQTGRIIVLLGPNGAGKSRLLEIAAGLLEAEGIAANYGGAPVPPRRGGGAARSSGLLAYSYACQSPEEQLFARSVEGELDYVLRPYGLSAEQRRQAGLNALRAVGWDASWLARDPYAMSGGERRRTALVSALAPPAAWLLLDEPTAGLDAWGCDGLAESLAVERRKGRGILLVSHDPDWALPLADELLLLGSDGRIRHCEREALLEHPDWWEEMGLRQPASYSAARAAWNNGVEEARAWDIAAVAECVGSAQAITGNGSVAARFAVWPRPTEADDAINTNKSDGHRSPSGVRRDRLSRFDPRAVWLGYASLSLAMFAAPGWIGLASSAVLTAAIVVLARLPLRAYKAPIMAFAAFAVASTILSGLTGNSGAPGQWWHADDSWATFRSFAKTWLVLVLGIGLPAAIQPLRLRRALAQVLPRRGAAGRRTQRLVLTVTLLLRFVPQLMAEWERYARIAIARGKDTAKSPAAWLRRLRSTAVPFMLSLFRMGETVTLALESRGIGRRDAPTDAERLRWQARDSLLLAAIAIAIAGMLLLPSHPL